MYVVTLIFVTVLFDLMIALLNLRDVARWTRARERQQQKAPEAARLGG
jgi:hypothetical protein